MNAEERINGLEETITEFESKYKRYIIRSEGRILESFKEALNQSDTSKKMNAVITLLALIMLGVSFVIFSLFMLAE